jgi:hypothetical protein
MAAGVSVLRRSRSHSLRRFYLLGPLPLLFAMALARCGGPQQGEASGGECFRDADCKEGLVCVAGACSSDVDSLVSIVEGPGTTAMTATGGAGGIGGMTATNSTTSTSTGAGGTVGAGGSTVGAGGSTVGAGGSTVGVSAGGAVGAGGSGTLTSAATLTASSTGVSGGAGAPP